MQTLRASDCGLSIALLSPAILEVIDTLTKAGYEAYIVGGGVRDLLLGLHPKDFDAVTNATPAQIREIFGRRCRIIGRLNFSKIISLTTELTHEKPTILIDAK